MLKSSSGSSERDITLSKKLSWLLRHGALKKGVHIGADGFVNVTEILEHPSFGGKYTIGDIERIVECNDKKRFSIRIHPETGRLQIRANQGHSLDVVTDLELIPILSSSDNPVVIHGTYFENWRKIKAEGLSRMSRQHIHFSPGELGSSNVISGMRSSCQLYIYIDINKALADGIQFYKSSNNVILSPGDARGYISPKYFRKVVEVSSDIEDKMTDVKCDICNVTVQQRNMNDHIRGKKHMKALQWRERKEKAQQNGIFVRGFPRDITEEEVYGYFSRCGEITEFNFDKNGQFAVIEFRKRESANYCLTRPLFIGDFRLYVKNRHMREGPTRAEAVTAVRVDILNHERISSLLASYNGNFEEQLSVLLREIQPPENNYHRIICGHLEYTFYQTFPGCKAYPFGSTVTGLSFKGSDLDVFMDINSRDENTEELSNSVINRGKKLLSRNSQYFRHIFGIPKAKTPIIKFVHVPTKTNCDLSFKNALGVNNSGLIRFYLSMDPRLRPMLLIIKYWARRHDLSGAGKLTNYAIIMLALCYLQQMPQPVIPTVYDLQRTCERKTIISGWDCSYQGKTDSVGLGKNTMSIPELLHGFFKFYSTFDFEMYLVCPLIGEILEKSAFQNPDSLPQELIQYKEKVSLPESTVRFRADTFMCIQDPFELTHNLSAGMGAKAVEKFKLYCEAAADLCNEALKSEAHFLWNLFDESRKPRDIFWFGKSTLFKFSVIQKLVNNFEQTAEIYLKALLEIFEKVLKVETEVVDHVSHENVQKQKSEDLGQSMNKIQKLEGQVDVGRATQEVNADQQEMQSSSEHKLENLEGKFWKPKEIHCSGKVRVWEGRKVIFKSLEFPDGTDLLTKEEMVSQYLEKEQLERKQISSINFVCLLKLKQDPTQAFLELHDKSCSKGDFVNLRTYLQHNLVRLVNKCAKDNYMPKTEENMNVDIIHLWWIPLVGLMLLIYNLRSWIRTAILVSRLPGPPAIPFVGNVLQFCHSRALAEFAVKLHKQNLPLVRIWATVIPVIILFSPDFIQTVLSGKEQLEKSSLYSILKPSLGNSLVTASVHNWQKHRKIINPTFHMRVIENFVPVFMMNSKRMVAAMKKFVETQAAFDVTEFSFPCTLDIICETTMGTPVNAQDCNLFRDFSLTALIAYDIQIHRLLKPWLLFESFFKFTEGSKIVRNHCLQVEELSDKVVQRRRDVIKSSNQDISESDNGQKTPSVFLDFLLKLQEEGHGLTDTELMNEVKTIIMAGHETASQTSSFCLYLLGLHPEIQAKVHEELNSIFGNSDRDATLEDLRSMKYLERCVMETLRLFPAVPVIGRRTTYDINLGNYKIPAGCELMIPIMLVHRQKKHYPHPYEFNPDNFLHEKIQKRHSFAYLPFSAGPRNCIGQRFALLELKALVSTVLRSYRVESLSKVALENLTWKITLKTRHPMLIKMHPRQQ